MTSVLGFSLYGPQAASHRVRLSQFQPGLEAVGIDLQIQSLLNDDYLHRSFSGRRPSLRSLVAAYAGRITALRQMHHFSLAIVYGDLLPFVPSWIERTLLQTPFIYDLDDAFFLKYDSPSLRLLKPLLGAKAEHLIEAAAVVTAGNADLASYARAFNRNVVLLPSVVDTLHYYPVNYPLCEPLVEPFTVGWIGSPSTAPYLQLLIDPLQKLALERPVRLLVVGGPAPSIAGVEVIQHRWTLQDEISLIHQFDVGVMPLPDTPWTRGKCAFKLIQCMSCGIPVVASPVGANINVVHPSCGFLASSPDQWLRSLRILAADPVLRSKMGSSARNIVENKYSLSIALPILHEAIQIAIDCN